MDCTNFHDGIQQGKLEPWLRNLSLIGWVILGLRGGKLTPGRLMEDMYFIQRLHELDIPIFVDCGQTLPHIANITIKPRVHEGRWYVGYDSKTGPVLWDALVPPPLIRRVAHANESVKVVGDL